MKKHLRIYFTALLTASLLFACDKETESTAIPYVYVNFTLYPNTLDFIPDGSSASTSGGYKGIIVYRLLHEQFMAYERACPYDPLNDSSVVQVETSGVIAACPHCGSRFLLTDGSPLEGPAKVGLKQYRTYYDGFSLIISN